MLDSSATNLEAILAWEMTRLGPSLNHPSEVLCSQADTHHSKTEIIELNPQILQFSYQDYRSHNV